MHDVCVAAMFVSKSWHSFSRHFQWSAPQRTRSPNGMWFSVPRHVPDSSMRCAGTDLAVPAANMMDPQGDSSRIRAGSTSAYGNPPHEGMATVMPAQLLIGRVADGLILRVVGRATMQESLAFRAAVESNVSGGAIIFDAMQCDHLDSTFLGCLIGIKKACESSACRFFIHATNATRVKLFSTSSLDRFFDFIDTCPEPSDELQPIDIEKLDPMTLGRHAMRCHEHLAERGGREAAAFRSVADCLRKEIGENPAE